MIAANELRIGNKVLRTKNNSLFTITAIDISTIANGDLSVTGIPLTPEILEQCGFKKSHQGYMELSRDEFNLAFDETGLDIAINGNDIANTLSHIKYLHQLQNLYFALTGTELEINLHVATAN